MNFIAFDDRESASVAAAEQLATSIRQQLASSDNALFAVSGGTTPKACLNRLSETKLPWHRVQVTLTDERCVPQDHSERNEQMLRECLLRSEAKQAKFIALDDLADEPFAAVLLGMGTDGHFASLFPDADNLLDALDPNCRKQTLPIKTAASPYARVSLTLARLQNSASLSLLVFGADKRELIEAASAKVSDGLPISHVLNQNIVPVHVLWAP